MEDNELHRTYYWEHEEFRDRKKKKMELANKKYHEANRDRLNDYHRGQKKSLRGRANAIRGQAKSRSISYELTLEQLETFWQKPCFIPSCPNKIETVNLDRVDNTKGYTIDNVRSCCLDHNKIKMAHTDDKLYLLAKGFVEWYEQRNDKN